MTTAARLAQLDKRQSAEREAAGCNFTCEITNYRWIVCKNVMETCNATLENTEYTLLIWNTYLLHHRDKM